MNKLDLTKKYKSYYTAKTKPEVVEVEPAQFISITGKGDPNGKPFAEKLETLFPVAYAIKFACKESGRDFVVAKLEGLWSFDEKKFAGKSITSSSVEVPRSEWEYRLLLRMPEFVTRKHLQDAVKKVVSKKELPLVGQIEFFELEEGKCVQMLHVGPFSKEPESLEIMATFMEAHQFKKNGSHHEIYLSDFRKTKPEKLKTILREPVR